jgi:hypothetical protein
LIPTQVQICNGKNTFVSAGFIPQDRLKKKPLFMKYIFASLLFALLVAGCHKSSDTSAPVLTPGSTDNSTTNDFGRLYAKLYNIVSIDSSSTSTITIRTNDLPDHKTPFYGIGHAKYEAYNGDNPNFSTSINLGGMISDPTLLSHSTTFVLPRRPSPAATHVNTTGGAIGIGRNGVLFFNQYNGGGAALDALEINNADQYLGHPTPTAAGATYHYHYEPKYLTTTFGNNSFMGFLLDGYPVYGPYENGVKVSQTMLDIYNGHVSSTVDYPGERIYHYHVISAASSAAAVLTQAAPYINGGKYYGTKGTVN